MSRRRRMRKGGRPKIRKHVGGHMNVYNDFAPTHVTSPHHNSGVGLATEWATMYGSVQDPANPGPTVQDVVHTVDHVLYGESGIPGGTAQQTSSPTPPMGGQRPMRVTGNQRSNTRGQTMQLKRGGRTKRKLHAGGNNPTIRDWTHASFGGSPPPVNVQDAVHLMDHVGNYAGPYTVGDPSLGPGGMRRGGRIKRMPHGGPHNGNNGNSGLPARHRNINNPDCSSGRISHINQFGETVCH